MQRVGPVSSVLAVLLFVAAATAQQPTGELRLWHGLALTFQGPAVAETSTPNPFTDYRLDVEFRAPSGRLVVIPGYFAADGNAAESGAEAGPAWRVRFAPDEVGHWEWRAHFTTGSMVAVLGGGRSTAFDGAAGGFDVAPTDKRLPDFRAVGFLRQGDERFPRFVGTGEPFLEVGVNSPENLFACRDIDGTSDRGGVVPGFLHEFRRHRDDFVRLGGGPAWRGEGGRGVLGLISYLSEQRLNSMFALTLGVDGDGDDVWPFVAPTDPWRYDCSKLDQWQRVLEHATQRGVHAQLGLTETENESLFEVVEGLSGGFAASRQLYHRELVARFAHVLGLTWNLGEEIGKDPGYGSPFRRPTTDSQRRQFAAHLRGLDAYDHGVIVHSYYHGRIHEPHQVLDPLSDPTNPAVDITGVSLQGPFDTARSVTAPSADRFANDHAYVRYYVERSLRAGKPWSVGMHEQGPAFWGAVTDGFARDPQHDVTRRDVLWGTWMAGGTGVQYYFGYGLRDLSGDDVTVESLHTRAELWRQSRVAHDFFTGHLPFDRMLCRDELVADPLAYCLALPGSHYAVYLRGGGTTTLDLGAHLTEFEVAWYDPRQGGALQAGSVTAVQGPGPVALGAPPSAPTQDWVVLVRDTGRIPGSGCAGAAAVTVSPTPRLGATVVARLPAPSQQGAPVLLLGAPLAMPVPLSVPSPACGPAPCSLALAPWEGVLADRLQFTVPADPGLLGTRFALQGAHLRIVGDCLEVHGAVLPLITE